MTMYVRAGKARERVLSVMRLAVDGLLLRTILKDGAARTLVIMVVSGR